MKHFQKIKPFLLIVVFIFIIILSIPFYVKFSVRNKNFVKISNIGAREFAIVLGAGIKVNGTPGSYLKQRLDDAVILFRNGKIKKILLSGDNSKNDYDELSVMNNYLLQMGVPQNSIFADYAGFDTYSTMERAKKIFDIKEAVILTQGYHLPRSVYIANYKGIDAIGFTTHSSYGKRRYFVREWLATIKSFLDCMFNRKAEFYGIKVNTNTSSNIEQLQL
jgi:SanA protein